MLTNVAVAIILSITVDGAIVLPYQREAVWESKRDMDISFLELTAMNTYAGVCKLVMARTDFGNGLDPPWGAFFIISKFVHSILRALNHAQYPSSTYNDAS
jgi:hypothetical protein